MIDELHRWFNKTEIDNSAAERALRAVALGRKDHLFAGSDAGGENKAAAIYTLLGTARLNGIDPERWLCEVLSRIPDHPLSRIDELLPWNMTLNSQTDSPTLAAGEEINTTTRTSRFGTWPPSDFKR